MVGIFAAFGACLTWTFASFLWRNERHNFRAVEINIIKNLIGSLIFLPVILSINWLTDWKSIILLASSGFFGIVVGDTFYLESLNILGVRRLLTIVSSSPLLAVLIGYLFLGEVLSKSSLFGVILVSFSILLVSLQPPPGYSLEGNNALRLQSKGFMYAIISLVFALIGAAISRYVLINSDISTLQATEVRLLSSFLLLMVLDRNYKFIFKIKKKITRSNLLRLSLSTILGTNLGILFQLIVFKSLSIGVGVALLSVSPIFAVFFAAQEEDRLSLSAVISSLMCVTGVALIVV